MTYRPNEAKIRSNTKIYQSKFVMLNEFGIFLAFALEIRLHHFKFTSISHPNRSKHDFFVRIPQITSQYGIIINSL